MLKRGHVPKQRRVFSLTAGATLILSSLLISISVQVPNVTAGSPKNHNVGNVEINMLTDWGRIIDPIKWKGDNKDQTIKDPAGLGFIGLVIDHDDYVHTPGAEDIADSFNTGPYYASQDDLQVVNDITMIIDDGTTQKSLASFQNKGAGFPDDILINQTAWTVLNKDWAIIQWSLLNLKGVPLTSVSIGLELPLSVVGGSGGVGGDSGDDIDGFDAVNNTYWVQDNDSKTTMGFCSAIVSEPITHYYSEDYGNTYTFNEYKYLYENDTWLYERLTAPNAVGGTTPGNRTTTVGWDNFDIGAGSFKIFTLVIAVNDSFDSMNAMVQDAQNYFNYVASSFRITEFNDADTVGNQKIEVYNDGKGATDLHAAGYRLSVNGGTSFLTGDSADWNPNPLPIHKYGVFTLDPMENIPSEGGTIGLYQDLGGGNVILIDEVSYGQKGTAPDPLGGESVARRYDASMVTYTNEWLRNGSTGTTWGAPNNVGSIILPPQVVLNRVMFNSQDVAEGYVELIRRIGGILDISGYRIVCDNEFIVPPGTVLNPSNMFCYVLNQSSSPQFFLNMSNVADNIYLYDNNDNLLDMVGWSSSHSQGYFMSRVPDRNGTFKGFNDGSSQSAGWVFDQSYQLQNLHITEFYVNSTSAQIEVCNLRGGDKVLDSLPPRLTLNVDNGPLTGTWEPTTIPANGGYSIFTMDVTGGNPDEEGDTISLHYDPGSGGILIDEVSFGTNGVAPDPVIGESTARYYDDSIPGYSNDWTRNASTGPTWGSQNDVEPIDSTPSIILNEVMFNPAAPDGGYVVIINKELWTINARDYHLVCDNVYQLSRFGDIILDPFERYIIGYNPADPALTAFFQNMTPGGDNVYLLDVSGQLLDMVGWNSPHTTGMSVRRVPDGNGTHQGYNDTTSEAAGWVFDKHFKILMTEISDSESAVAQIEVYNPQYPTIDFSVGSVFTFENKLPMTLPGSWMMSTADRGQYAVFNVTSGLNPEGDTISFYQNGILIEEISYGLEGTVPDPLPNESVERYWNGVTYTEVWERNYTTGPNFGSQNDVPEANLSSSIILNELLFNPTISGDYFVEIFNRNATLVDVSGYKIVCDTEYIVPDVTILDLNDRFFYLRYNMNNTFFDNMDSSGDNVYLYDARGSLLDMVGWNSLHPLNKTICRVPDGNGTRDGYDDVSSVSAGWRFDQVPSISLIQINPDSEKYGSPGQDVRYDLYLLNKQDNDDVVDINNVSGPWGWEVVILDGIGTPLTDSNGNGLPDIFVPVGLRVSITVVVSVPADAPIRGYETTIITAQSTFNTWITDNVTLITRVLFLDTITFPAGSFIIPMDDKQNDIIKAFGFIHALLRNGGYIYRIIEPPDVAIRTTTFPSGEYYYGGPILVFPENATIVNLVQLSFPTVTLDTITVSFTSKMVYAVIEPTNIIVIYGSWGLTNTLLDEMEIPYTQIDRTEAESNPSLIGPPHNLVVVDCTGWAGSAPSGVVNAIRTLVENGGEAMFNCYATQTMIQIFPGYVNGNLVGNHAENSQFHPIPEFPAQYYGPPTMEFTDIWAEMEAVHPDVRVMWTTEDPVYNDAAIYFPYGNNGGIVVGTIFEPGHQLLGSESRKYACILYGNKFVHLPPIPKILDISPPTLYIKAIGDDIILNWTQSSTTGISHYLIYRATSQTEFDFSNIWVNTSQYDDNGIIPLRTTLNDTVAASVLAPPEYYYIIRAVSTSGEISPTSRTVGKWTTTFGPGVSTFSLPLEPLNTTYVDDITTDMGADSIKYIDTSTHIWIQHNFGDGNTNNVAMKLGEGYEVKFSTQTTFTFTGMPGAMITYDNDTGFAGFNYASDAKSLSVSVLPNGDVDLTWQEPAGMGAGDWYELYYSNTRDGFFGKLDVDYFPAGPSLISGSNTFTHPGALANAPGTQLYYMVVPFNSNGIRGSSTYSIGIWTEEILSQYDSFGIPLKTVSTHSADWYCDNINDTVGINYFMFSQQRWGWHSTRMAAGAFDPILVMTEGYQISTSVATKFTFIGI